MSETSGGTLPWLRGTVVGIVAWLGGYAITYFVVADDVRDSPLHQFIELFEGTPATYELVGWVFFNAHTVQILYEGVPIIGSGTETFIGGDGMSPWLYAIPVLILILAGIAIGYQATGSTLREGAETGLTLVPGYLLMSAAGILVFEITMGGATGRPEPIPALLIAGLVYPVLCGAFGGILGITAKRLG